MNSEIKNDSCMNCAYGEWGIDDGIEKVFCHHDEIMDEAKFIVFDCLLWEKYNAST